MGWQRDYSPPAWRNRATDEQKMIGWEMAVRIEKILCTVLHEAHERQVEGAMEILAQGPSTAVTWTAKGSIAPRAPTRCAD